MGKPAATARPRLTSLTHSFTLDFVILCRDATRASRALAEVRDWTQGAGLQLHPVKTRIVAAGQVGGFDFLGYHFERGERRPRQKSLDKFKNAVRAKTRRNNGQSLATIITHLNRMLRGWFEYYKHSHRSTFATLDSWIRGRLRSLLRRRTKRRGRERGTDHVRWPNAFFAKQGLFSLVTARVLAGQSSLRSYP